MQGAAEDFASADGGLVLIGQATPRHAAHFRRRLGVELPVLADEQRITYKAIGAKVSGVGGLFGPKVVAKGIATIASKRVVQGKTIGHAGQLGGALVIAPGGRVVFAQIAHDAGDNASPGELLAAIQAQPAPA